jgi:hypothetical protein
MENGAAVERAGTTFAADAVFPFAFALGKIDEVSITAYVPGWRVMNISSLFLS